MTDPKKSRGDRAEREVAELLSELGWPSRRKLGAGRADDTGDIDVIGADVVIQVADWRDKVAAIRAKVPDAEEQRRNAGARFAATFLRLWGGDYVVVLSPEQWAAYVEAAS